MDGEAPSETETEYLAERVTEELEARGDVASFEVEPADTVGVVATVRSDARTEYYRVTVENRPDGDRKLNWSSLGGEPDR